MKIKYISFRLAAILMACVLFLEMACLPQTVQAAETGNNTLTLTYAPDEMAIEGVTFRLYRVAEVSQEQVSIHPIEPYSGYNVLNGRGDWLSKAATLAAYVARDHLEETAQARTNAAGMFTVTGLEDGMYLIVGESIWRNGYRYTPVPFLLCLPNTTDGHSWDQTVSTYAKFERTVPGDATVQRRVLKVWEDAGNEEVRPESITVDLLADGVVYDTVTLSAGNNWRHHWTGLDAGIQWQVVEREIPGYTVSAEENGITFILTNTLQDETDITDPDVPLEDKPTEDDDTDIFDEDVPLADLPQTGQLWWPVPLLALAGMILLILGVAQRRRSAWDEE